MMGPPGPMMRPPLRTHGNMSNNYGMGNMQGPPPGGMHGPPGNMQGPPSFMVRTLEEVKGVNGLVNG